MRALCYLMFRIYRFYIDRRIERDMPLFYMSIGVTVFVWINIFTLYAFLANFHFVKYVDEILPNKYYVVLPMAVLWCIIYFGIVRPKRFLNYNFKKSVLGGVAVIGYMVLTALLFVLVANINRARLAEEHLANPVQTEQVQKKPSLEGKIKKWFEDNF